MTFSSLKKNRKSNFDKLTQEMEKASGRSNFQKEKDERLWYPAVDKAGNGAALIRFLPAPEGEDIPFVRMFTHSFQGPTGSWYIENCLSTIGKDDPVSEYNTKLWNSGIESDKDTARKQKRKLSFYSNIYVIKDPANPENEGKVFLFKFGKKIWDKLTRAANPPKEEDDEDLMDENETKEPFDPFDLWEGANFRIKIRNVAGYRNYDESKFLKPSPLFDDEKKMEEVWKQGHSLQEFIKPEKFKPYAELKAKLNRVLGLNEDIGGIENQLGGKEGDLGWKEKKAAKPKEEAAPDLEGDEIDLDFLKEITDDEEELIS